MDLWRIGWWCAHRLLLLTVKAHRYSWCEHAEIAIDEECRRLVECEPVFHLGIMGATIVSKALPYYRRNRK
jgi:hypothetical protein